MKREIKVGRVYKHFKGGLYQVENLAIHSETGEKLVIYLALYGSRETYARPYDMFASDIGSRSFTKG